MFPFSSPKWWCCVLESVSKDIILIFSTQSTFTLRCVPAVSSAVFASTNIKCSVRFNGAGLSYGTSRLSSPILPHKFLLTCLHESQTILGVAEDESAEWFILSDFWSQSFAKLYLLIKGFAYDPSQGPATIERYFQTGGETYEHGWISWGEA